VEACCTWCGMSWGCTSALGRRYVSQPPPKRRYRVEASGTTFTYVYCYRAAQRALAHAEQVEQGSFYFLMMAGVFAAFTVEAFLNHVGQEKVRDWKALEKKLGPWEKLLLLRQLRSWTADEDARPYRTLCIEMLRLRNGLAHGKTETVVHKREVTREPPDLEPWPEPQWKLLCAPSTVKRMVEDAGAIVRDLDKQSGGVGDPFASPGHGSGGIGLVE